MEKGNIMMDHIDANQTLRLFCQAWFEQRDAGAALGYVADDIRFVGTGENEYACGKDEMFQYLLQDIREIPEPFRVDISVVHEQCPEEPVSILSSEFTLKNTVYSWFLRCFCVFCLQDGRWLLSTLHFSEPASTQRNGEHYPKALVLENITKQRQELLNEAFAGGMMGHYREEGSPFYFINQRMLQYLGYLDEKEFVEEIGGCISNCTHPEDRSFVERSIQAQLDSGEEYTVEYRMRKKDGSYIWIHDTGHKTLAEDGRPAITSVCSDITAQRLAQLEVMNIYNNIPGAVFRCRFDSDFSVIDANDGLFDFLGYSREEFAAMGSRMSAVIYPEDLVVMEEKLRAQLEHGNTIQNENRLVCKNGQVKWISIKAQLFAGENGEQYFYCVFVDITDEKNVQERVKELYEEELAYFAELSSEGGLVQGRLNVTQNRLENYISTEDTAIAEIGDTYDEAVKRLAASAVDIGYGRKIFRDLQREKVLAGYASGKTTYHFEFQRRSSSQGSFWCNTSLRFCLNPESGDIICFFYTFDVTEKMVQEQLLHRIAELDYDIVTEIDIQEDTHRPVSIHCGQKELVPGPSRFQDAIRKIADQCMEQEDREEYLQKLDYQYIKEHLEQKDSYSFIVEMRDRTGVMRVKRFQVFYINKALGRVGMSRTDVTDVARKEQRQKEDLAAALVAAEQANAAKSDFLSRMSHEIRTPMNAIIGMSTIAAQSIGDDEQVEDCISKIGISSRFLLSLINDILDMSRIESGKMLLKNEKIPTEDFLNGINSICYAQAAARGVDYECIVDPVLDDYYMGDAMKLQQVLINILSNAIKFTKEGGKVTLSAALRRKTKNDAVLRFIVNDTGIGISEEFIPHIFEPFSQESTGTTAPYGGSGLGLAISKNIVDMMDGKINVRSIKGIGTEFTVDVKLGITEEEKLRHNKRKSVHNFSHLKTLVVDDDVAVCESAIVTLEEMGIKAEWVDSGRKAVERVSALWAGGRYFDMILIDWKMPEMDGIETARRIRQIVGPDVTIIIMTAYDWICIEHEAKLAGVNLLMSKPMFKSSLISAFTRALGEKEEQERQPEVSDYDFSGKRVLLAEDNMINTEVAVMLLEGKGFVVHTAENGLRAMEMYGKSPDGYYDAILMDIRMPLMDGLTAARNIRHLSNPDAETIPIIAMTANAFDDDIEKSKAAGMDAHLAKTIEPERLFQTLYDFIFGKEA